MTESDNLDSDSEKIRTAISCTDIYNSCSYPMPRPRCNNRTPIRNSRSGDNCVYQSRWGRKEESEIGNRNMVNINEWPTNIL
jgi:hypothetical protein